jgi:hypothetical protein
MNFTIVELSEKLDQINALCISPCMSSQRGISRKSKLIYMTKADLQLHRIREMDYEGVRESF